MELTNGGNTSIARFKYSAVTWAAGISWSRKSRYALVFLPYGSTTSKSASDGGGVLDVQSAVGGTYSDLILAGRRLNDGMAAHVASTLVKTMAKEGIPAAGSRIAILGLTFKEDTPDLRNTKIVDVVSELEEYGAVVDVFDPTADPVEAHDHYGIDLKPSPERDHYDAVAVAVPQAEYRALKEEDLRDLLKGDEGTVFDLKSMFPKEWSNVRL